MKGEIINDFPFIHDYFRLSDKVLGQTEKARGTVKTTLLCLLFFSLQVAMFFLIFFFAITSCTKSMSEQSEAESMIHTFNHNAKDSKKTKQLLTEMI